MAAMLGVGGGGGGCSCQTPFYGVQPTPVPRNPFDFYGAAQAPIRYQQTAYPGYNYSPGGPLPARTYSQPNANYGVSGLNPYYQPLGNLIMQSGVPWAINQYGDPRLIGSTNPYGAIDALGGPQRVQAAFAQQAPNLQPYMSTAQYVAQQAAAAKQGGELHQADYIKLGGTVIGAVAGGLLLGPGGVGLGAGVGGLAGGYLGGL
jgi:hypothetical protein